MCFLSVFGVDIYMRMPSNFYVVEAGIRLAPQSLVSLYLCAFPLGGLLTCWVMPTLLRYNAPNRLNRLSLLLSSLTATLQGLATILDEPPPAAFIAYTTTMRFLEGTAALVTEVRAPRPPPPPNPPPALASISQA